MYEKMKLKYSLDALEPYISEETMRVHYDVLYTRYLDNLNQLLTKNHFSFNIPKEEIYNIIHRFPIEDRENILFNLGGTINHEMYFSLLTPQGKENQHFQKRIEDEYLSFSNFMDQYIKKAKELRGSGYTFLVMDQDRKLALMNLPNQDNPYRLGLFPIMNLDLWEHAYFLDYQANKEEYLKSFFAILNLEEANQNYIKAHESICSF